MDSTKTDDDHHIKITDINQFCLEHICMYLDLKDLLNLADANKHLKLVTGAHFGRKCAGKSIIIDQRFSNAFPNFKSDQTYIMECDKIRIYNLKMSFQILRCFCPSIVDLELDYRYREIDKLPTSYRCIIDYMHKFCVESVNRLVLHPASSLKYFTKCFENVEKLEIGSLLENRLSSVFPNLKSLEFEDYSYVRAELDHFPHLYHLKIPLFNSKHNQKIAAASILRVNPQLKSLQIKTANFDFFQENIEQLQNIESLHIDLQPYKNPQFNGNPLYFQNIKKLEMVFIYSIYSGSIKPIIPFSFDQLKEFGIGGISEFNDSIYVFLVTNPSIEKLVLTQKNLIHKIDIVKLQNALPFLAEIVLPFSEFTIHDALSLLATFASLKQLSFICTDSEVEVRSVCGDKWQIEKTLNPLKETMFTLKQI
ncbi:uncharacterized protein LOC116352549 isoform X2 [Contarinia nasturtii]|nr:uncharacterized protein LOC116352549 isoform X2 [Contarinia nasturtii]